MQRHITRVKAIGVHDRFDFDQELQSGINIFYDFNGAGKTTFLQIIANVLNSDFYRFQHIKFKYIEITYSDNIVISLDWHTQKDVIRLSKSTLRRKPEIPNDSNNKVFNNSKIIYPDGFEPLVAPLYIPAFRLLVDAWFYSKKQDLRNHGDQINEKTLYARQIFGEFVPLIDYPSGIEVFTALSEDLRQARLKLASAERELFLYYLGNFYAANSKVEDQDNNENNSSDLNYEDIEKVINELENNQFQDKTISLRQFVKQIENLMSKDGLTLDKNYTNKHIVLQTYHQLFTDLLKKQKECYKDLEIYLKVVNQFLVDKQLVFSKENDDSQEPTFCFKYLNEIYGKSLVDGFQSLSSGERQIISFIHACYLARERIILIDEPEISLHIDWQRDLLASIGQYSHQLIICTHSPSIPADYNDRLFKLNVCQTDESVWNENYTDSLENDENVNYSGENEYTEDIEVAI
jgi:predicted ATPase